MSITPLLYRRTNKISRPKSLAEGYGTSPYFRVEACLLISWPILQFQNVPSSKTNWGVGKKKTLEVSCKIKFQQENGLEWTELIRDNKINTFYPCIDLSQFSILAEVDTVEHNYFQNGKAKSFLNRH